MDGYAIFVVVCEFYGIGNKFCDGAGGRERSFVGWCGLFGSYLDCMGLGKERRMDVWIG